MKKLFVFLSALLFVVIPVMAGKPLIGVSTSFSDGNSSTKIRYSRVIEKAGGIPVLIPLTKDEKVAEETIKKLDGIVFIGGEDFDPVLYGEKILNSTVEINAERDTSDLLLMKAALKSKKSILAICRGVQLLNVSLGGTLYQDLPAQYEGVMPHGGTPHIVEINCDSRLGRALGASRNSGKVIRLEVNSFHHQALKRVSPELNVTAKSSDGVVEAVEMPGKTFVIGTQFHPEIHADNGNALWLKLFDAFVKSAN